MPETATTHLEENEAGLEDLKADFRQAILDRSSVIRITRTLELLDVTIDTPDALIRDMNQDGFSRHYWRVTPLHIYPEIDLGEYGIHKTVPTVCARLDFRADSLDLRHIYSIDTNIREYLRLQNVTITWVGSENNIVFQPAQQFFFDANEDLIGASVLARLSIDSSQSKVYGHLHDRLYPEAHTREEQDQESRDQGEQNWEEHGA